MPEQSIYRSTWFIGILVLYFITGAVLYFPLRYQLNPDGIAYLTIAKDYYHGHWGDAINAYWSPLISWIIALFCWIPADPLFIFKWYNLVVGAMGLVAAVRLMERLQVKALTQQFMTGILAVFSLRFVFIVTTPDLTVTVLLLWFLPYWLAGNMLRKPVYTAVWLAVLYFAKAYNFFFLLALLLVDILQFSINREMPARKIVQQVMILLGLFFLFASPWLLALKDKYGYFMMAGTAKFNHGAAHFDNYAFMLQTVAPPNRHAIFAWEDPVLLSGFRDYGIFDSRENFLLQLRILWKNMREFLPGSITIYRIVFFGGLCMLATWIHKAVHTPGNSTPNKWFFKNVPFKILYFSNVYICGYLLFFVEDRYIWTSVFLSLIMGYYFFERFCAPEKYRKARQLVFGVGTLFLGYHMLYSNYFKAPPHYHGIAVTEYKTAQQFRANPSPANRMAKWPDNGGYPLFASWYVAYYAEVPHYFSLPASPAKANEAINKFGVNIVFADADIPVPAEIIFSTWKKLPSQIEGTVIFQRP